MINRLLVISIVCSLLSCNSKKEQLTSENPISKEVKFDSIFYNKFQLTGPGFTGGDGVYSVALPDGRNVWIFGDTFIGKVSPENTREQTDPLYIRNCFVVQDGAKMTTYPQGENTEFKSIMIPDEVDNINKDERDIWYWPGDGFVHENVLHVFVSKFHQKTDDMWGFEWLETELVQFSLPDLKETGKLKIPFSNENNVHYGHAVHKGKEHLYIYGLGNGRPYVARTTYNNISTDWEFLNDTEWTTDPKAAKPMVDFDGSEQFSVKEINGKFVFLSQFGQLSPEVFSMISDTPYGPWKNKKLLFKTPVDTTNKELFTYNALAHPQFISNNELLVSYNTNSFALDDHFKNAGIYKPRFMRVPLPLIFENN